MVEEEQLEGKCKVIVRVRPTLENEHKDAEAVSVDTDKNNIQVRLAHKKKNGLNAGAEKDGKATQKAKSYNFDCVLGPDQDQEDLFKACDVEGLVESSLRGYSQTVFAFGQTGSGKTYSICGTEDQDGDATTPRVTGLLEKAAVCCFDKASKTSSTVKVDITCLEIYQEQVTDLLVEKKQVLPVRHHPKYGFYVQNLTQKQCKTVGDYREVIVKAFQRRRVASHSLNERSTRSHLLITIHLTSEGGDDGMSTFGRLCFVDLAGSERLGDTKTKSSSATIRAETGSINKSLFALGTVISMLAAKGKRSNHVIIPFRDSKLTQLLMDSLQGKGRATMIVCCSPNQDHCDVTLSTLHYASLAQNVKSDPVIIHDPQDQLVIDLRKTIMELKQENKKLAVQLTQMASDGHISMPAQEINGKAPKPRKETKREEGATAVRRQEPEPAAPVPAPAPVPARKENKKSSEKIRILKERSTIKRNAKNRTASSQRSGSGAKPSVPRVLAHSPYGGDMGRTPNAKSSRRLSRGHSAKAKGRTPGSKKSVSKKSAEKRVLKESHKMNFAGQGDKAPSAQDFPDLAALEATFQAQLAGVHEANGNGSSESSGSGPAPLSGLDHSINAMADTFTEDDAKGAQEEFEGDAEAVRWAKKNPWFGNDYEMTEYAYEIHDYLVDRNVDPNSKQYYREIEARVRDRFPERMPKPTPAKKVRRASRTGRTVGSRLSQSAKAASRPIDGDLSLREEGSSTSSDSLNHHKYTPAKASGRVRNSFDFSASTDRGTKELSGLSKDQSERQYIVEELRRIKQEAEEERRWILNQISSTVSSYKL